MRQYKVNADKEFFGKFAKFAEEVNSLGELFQNEDAIVSRQETFEWITAFNECIGDLKSLRHNGIERLEEINKSVPLEIVVGKHSYRANDYLKEMMIYFNVNGETVFSKTNGSVITNKREIRATSVKMFPRGLKLSCVYIERGIPIGDCHHIFESMTNDCKIYYFN